MIRLIGVRFRSAGKVYYFDVKDFDLHVGEHVIVETARGPEYGTVANREREVADDMVAQPLRSVIRVATGEDEEKHSQLAGKEKEALRICREKIHNHNLEMKLVDAEYAFDGSRILFYFTAEGRIDFRDLVKDLASVFHTRIELRQIGVRDETRMLGGIGICGRELCCATYLSDFAPVSIKMAKEQNLSLNPGKISGVCGRLMCCLKNEEDTYEYLNAKMPKVGEEAVTSDGKAGKVIEINVLLQKAKVLFENGDNKEVEVFDVGDLTFTPRRRKNDRQDDRGDGRNSRPQKGDRPAKQDRGGKGGRPQKASAAAAEEKPGSMAESAGGNPAGTPEEGGSGSGAPAATPAGGGADETLAGAASPEASVRAASPEGVSGNASPDATDGTAPSEVSGGNASPERTAGGASCETSDESAPSEAPSEKASAAFLASGAQESASAAEAGMGSSAEAAGSVAEAAAGKRGGRERDRLQTGERARRGNSENRRGQRQPDRGDRDSGPGSRQKGRDSGNTWRSERQQNRDGRNPEREEGQTGQESKGSERRRGRDRRDFERRERLQGSEARDSDRGARPQGRDEKGRDYGRRQPGEEWERSDAESGQRTASRDGRTRNKGRNGRRQGDFSRREDGRERTQEGQRPQESRRDSGQERRRPGRNLNDRLGADRAYGNRAEGERRQKPSLSQRPEPAGTPGTAAPAGAEENPKADGRRASHEMRIYADDHAES